MFLKKSEVYNLKKNCLNLGYISREKSIQLQKESYFLIMMTWADKNEKGIISSKFYEYLISGRPIICIINGEDDEEIEKIFQDTNVGIVVWTDDNSNLKKLEEFILEHYKMYKAKEYVCQYNWDNVYKFSYKNLADRLMNLFITEQKVRCVE